MTNNFSKKSLFISTALFIFLCLVFGFLYKKVNDNNQKAEQGMVAWQTEAFRRNDINLLNRSLSQIADDSSLLESHFVQNSDIVPFLNSLEQLASPVGASVVINSVSAGLNNTGPNVELKVTGSFGAIYKYLTLLENFPYELYFNSVDIHTLAAAETSGTKNIKNSKWEAIFKIQLLSFTQ